MKRKRLKRAELLNNAIKEFCSITDGNKKREKLEYIRQVFGNEVAERARKMSPTFKYS